MARAKANFVWRAGRVRQLKKDASLAEYLAKHPDAVQVCCPPTLATMNRWVNDCYARALDGCKVEPDGECEHGLPSWLIALGYI